MSFLLSTAGSRGQQPSVAPPVNPSLPSDSELRKILVDRIDVQHKSIGMVVAITGPNGRRIIPYGRLNQTGSGQLSGDTVFEIGSVTKIFTALLLADMVQQGEVSLNDPVAKYLPPEVKMPERNGHSITLLDLATQTSGLPFFPSDIPLNDPGAAERIVAGYQTAKVYEFVSHYQLTRDIGSKWEYSNLGFALLGDALARRAGTDYESLLKARITGPLGMKSTSISLSPEMRSRLAAGYDVDLKSAPEVDMPAFVAAGCLHSTANDLLLLLEAFMNYKTSPLAPAMQEMLSPRRPGPGFQQALGWWIVSLGAADPGFIFHGGQTSGFSSAIAFDPRTRTGVVVLSNNTRDDGGLAWHLMRPNFPLADSASQKALQDEARKESTIDSKVLDLDTGRYRISSGPGAGEIITVQRTGAYLVMKTSSTPPAGLRLHARTERTFFVTETDLQIEFKSDAGNPASGIEILFAGSKTFASRVPVTNEN
jgi:D-alanyl-D-alanine-carboxypeptidase/D-alanyl-D-alanine-endopeptidase